MIRLASRLGRVSADCAQVVLLIGLLTASAANANDGTYSIVYPLGRWGHTASYDPIRHRMIVFGGLHADRRNDVWTLDPAAPAWTTLTPAGAPPAARYDHSQIYDPVRNRLIVFGGVGSDSILSDLWALNLPGTPTWALLAPTGTAPGPRWGHSAVYDPVRDRMLVFGGSKGTTDYNEVWALSLAGAPAWTLLTTSGTPPAVRRGQSVIYDAQNDRLVLFAGYRQIPPSAFQKYQDVWTLTLTGTPTWSQIFPGGTSPDARDAHTATYDPIRHTMAVFGGEQTSDPSQLWTLSLSGTLTWTAVNFAGSKPVGRFQHTMVYDSDGDRMLLFGGFNNRTDSWALTLAGTPNWTQLMPPNVPPPGRNNAQAAFDPVGHRMVMFSGNGGIPNDLWQLALPAGSEPLWTQLTPSGTPPAPRGDGTLVHDSARQRMLLFGGVAATRYNDVWAVSLSGGTSWTPLSPTGTPPSTRFAHTAIYDPVRDRMLVFGGNDGTNRLNEVWSLALSGTPSWTLLAPTGTPPSARMDATAIYDPLRDRMVVFGGYTITTGQANDVWALSLAGTPAWTQLSPSGTPPQGRDYHTAVYDSYRDRMLVVGGHGASFETFTDVWELSFGSITWRQLSITGTPLVGDLHVSVYDSLSDRVVSSGPETQAIQFPLSYLLRGSSGANGSISPAGIVPVVAGQNQTFTFTPNACYHLAQVLVDGSAVGTTPSYTFTNVQTTHNISVNFVLDVETITASAGVHGSIVPSGAVPVNCGAAQTFTITPVTGFGVTDVLVDGVSVGAVTSYAFPSVTGARTIMASFAQRPTPVEPYCATDGNVNALARSGDILYFGGGFTRVGPPTGGAGVIDTTTGIAQAPYMAVNGTVNAVAPDGAGGWYLGGSFTNIRGQPRNNLARILADGTVASWDPSPDGMVNAIAASGSKVCVGGQFQNIAGEWHPSFAALEAASGAIELTPAFATTGSLVRALVCSANRVYIAGQFDAVGTPTGGWASLDSVTALARRPFAGLASGIVRAAVPDGAGGWFIGGSFSTVLGVSRINLAHLLADGTVAAWSTNVSGTDASVYALALSGTTLYVGGAFSNVGGQTRNRGAALDATSGAVLGWNPNASWVSGTGVIKCLAVAGGVVYAGGDFSTIGGASRSNIAALDPTTGTATTWNPTSSATVNTLTVSGGGVYVGGQFSNIGGSPRSFLAALDPATGAAQFWNPSANGGVSTLLVSGSIVYVGGDFTSVGGQAHNRIAALNNTNGAASPWDPNANSTVRAIAVSGSTVYAGGDFSTVGGASRSQLAALDATTGTARAWDPHPAGTVYVLQAAPHAVFVGGMFSSVNLTLRRSLAALDLTSGNPTQWDPNPSSFANLYSLAIDDGIVYVGGVNMSTIGGTTRTNVAAVDTSAGLATTWNPTANLAVRGITVLNGVVYIGGDFTSVNSTGRIRIAAIDATTGALTAWNPGAGNAVNALVGSKGVIYAGGVFSTIAGAPRSGIAALDAVSGIATPWSPGANNVVNALGLANGRLAAGGAFTFLNPVTRNNLAAMSVSTGTVTPWHPDPNSSVNAIQVSRGVVYVGGLFSSIGGGSRQYIAAIDSTTGAATTWNPAAAGSVNTLAVSDSVVFAGGQFSSIGGQPRTRLAALSATTGHAIFWNPDPNGTLVTALQLTPNGLYVAGDFTSISGVARNGTALVDSASGAALSWNPNVTGSVNAITRLGSAVYLGGLFTAVGGQTRANLAAVDATSGAVAAWNPGTNNRVNALGTSSGLVYVGGAFTNAGGRPRNRIAALDPVTGSAQPWNPDLDGAVSSILASGPTLILGGAFTGIGSRTCRSLAGLSDGVTVAVPTSRTPVAPRLELAQNVPNPFIGRCVIHFSLPRAGTVSLRLFDIGGRAINTLIDRTPMIAGPHDMILDATSQPPGVYFYRLDVERHSVTRRLVVLR
jgi:hypothetical protein